MARTKKGDYTTAEWIEKFEIFWKIYPAREGKRTGKTEAKKAWLKLDRTDATFMKIMSSLDDHRTLPDWQKGTKFVPMASTWLNKGRYEDEITSQETESEEIKVQSIHSDTTETSGAVPSSGSLRQKYIEHAGIIVGD